MATLISFLFHRSDKRWKFNGEQKFEVEAVGWGTVFSQGETEIDDKGTVAPASSCMTSETGPIESRFHPCDMAQLKVLLCLE